MPDPEHLPLQTAIKYNPHLWSEDELRAVFVARGGELDGVLDRLRATAPGRVPQHLLVTGYRGMGKTTLLRRIALAVADDPELASGWIPLTFPEEQYTVSTLAELWMNVLDALADALEREGAAPSELARLDAGVRALPALDPGAREVAALELLETWIDEHRRRILLLIDSSDLLLAALGRAEGKRGKGSDAGATPLWRLRKTLSHCPGILWLGASYQALEADHQYSDAFHDFFEVLELQPLSLEEMRKAMLALAHTFGAGKGLRGEAAVAEMARGLDARPERLKTLRALTGGNPRTTVILYELFAAGWQGDVHSDLKALLDLMTPLYKARMEHLAEQPRKLLAHLMEHWAPLGAGDLARAAGIPNTTVSGQLTRLEAEGLVEKTCLAGTSRSGYQVSERFFNIWYLMRNSPRRVRQRLSWLVEFMRLWFSADDLQRMAHRSMDSLRAGRQHGEHLEYALALSHTLPDGSEERHLLEWSVYSAARRLAEQTRKTLNELLPGLLEGQGPEQPLVAAEDYLRRFQALDAKLARCPRVEGAEVQGWVEAVKGSLSLTLADKEGVAAAAEGFSEEQLNGLRRAFESESDTWAAASSQDDYDRLRAAAVAGDFFPDCPNPELAYRQIVASFANAPGALRFALGLMESRHHDQWTERLYRKVIELGPTNAGRWNGLGNLLKNHLGRYEEAEAAYRKAIELDPKDAGPWNGLGNLLQDHLGRYEEAEAAYRKAIELDPKDAGPWNNLGHLLQDHLGRYEEAEAAYRKAIELDPKDAGPWIGLGNLLKSHLGRYEEAEAACRRAAELDSQNPYPLANLARLLAARGERGEVDRLYRRAVELATEKREGVPGIGTVELLLQAQLWLQNLDAAGLALGRLAEAAAGGDNLALFRLQEQARECHAVGLGQALADLMEESEYAELLRPIALALRAAQDGQTAFDGIPEEVRGMAEESLADILRRDGGSAERGSGPAS